MIEFILTISLLIVLLIPRVRSYLPVLFQNSKLISLMAISGVIHSGTAFLSNEHVLLLELYYSKWICMLVTVYIQYFIGLNIWVFCLLKLMINYGKFFNSNLFIMRMCSKKSTPKSKDIEMNLLTHARINGDDYNIYEQGNLMKGCCRYDYSTIYALTPTFLFIPIVSYSYFNIDKEMICRSEEVIKYAISAWCMVCIILVYFLNRKLYKIKYNRDKFKQYKPIEFILVCGVTVVVINVIIHSYGLWGYVSLRFAATASISILHMACIYALIGNHIYHALKKDIDYSIEFVQSHAWNQRVGLYHQSRRSAIEDFIKFCADHQTMSIHFPESAPARNVLHLLQEAHDELLKESINSQHNEQNSDTVYEWGRRVNKYLAYESPDNVAIILAIELMNSCNSVPERILRDPATYFKLCDKALLRDLTLMYLDKLFGAEFDSKNSSLRNLNVGSIINTNINVYSFEMSEFANEDRQELVFLDDPLKK